MIATVHPSFIRGAINAPSSKSTMQRACALALLNNGITTIYAPGKSNDERAALEIVASVGATVTFHADHITIKSDGIIRSNGLIDCGESGLALRMFLPILALSGDEIKVTGSGTLLNRPIEPLAESLRFLGVELSKTKLPLTMRGPMIPKNISIDGSGSSQYLTGLLFAFSSAAIEPVEIEVHDLVSRPYIDLSLQMLQHFGYDVTHNDYRLFKIRPAVKTIKHIDYINEGDWSSAAMLLVAAAVAGEITLSELDMRSPQADRAIIAILKSCGADITSKANTISVRKSKLDSFHFDATDAPDLFPALAILASHCNGTSVIAGTERLRSKESDRLKSITEMIERLGGDITIVENQMHIKGVTQLKGGCTIDAYSDHRIVMAATVAALTAQQPVMINDAEAVDKSYPQFFDDMKMLGANVSLSK